MGLDMGMGAVVCTMQTRKGYTGSFPLVLKDKRSCFSQGERSTVNSCLSVMRLPSISRMFN